MLSKEKCLQALLELSVYAEYNTNEVERKELAKESNLLRQLINEHFDNPPLKFEDLKEGMWVWDSKYKEYCYIYFIAGVYPHRKYIDNCESKFEENRFYRYEVKEDD